MMDVPWAEPEKHDRVELVDVGDQNDREHDEEKEVTEEEIRGEHAQLSNLAKELTSRLGQCVPTHSVPFTSPPSDVRGVGLEFTSEGQSDDELEEEALDSDDGDHTRQGLGEAPSFQEHHDFEECEEHDDGDGVGNSGQNSTELLAAHA